MTITIESNPKDPDMLDIVTKFSTRTTVWATVNKELFHEYRDQFKAGKSLTFELLNQGGNI